MSIEHRVDPNQEPQRLFDTTRGWYTRCLTILRESPSTDFSSDTRAITVGRGNDSTDAGQVIASSPQIVQVAFNSLSPEQPSARARISPAGEMVFATQPSGEFAIPQVYALTMKDPSQGSRLVTAAAPFFQDIEFQVHTDDEQLSDDEKQAIDTQLATWYEAAELLLADKGESIAPQHKHYWYTQEVTVGNTKYIVRISLLTITQNQGNGQITIRINKKQPPLPNEGHDEEQRRRLYSPDHIGERDVEINQKGGAKSSFVLDDRMIYEREDVTHVVYQKNEPYNRAHRREIGYLAQFLNQVLPVDQS